MDRPWIEAGLKYAILSASDLPALLVQRVARLRGRAGVDTRFLGCVVGSQRFTDYVLAIQTGTAVPHISGPTIKTFEFDLPPLNEQRAIAGILGALDDKIAVNRRMGATLEAMARATFKSWFVDFDPIHAKAAGRDSGLPPDLAALFPDGFDAGEVPAGWRTGTLGEVSSLGREQVNPGHRPDSLFAHYSLPAFDADGTPRRELGSTIKSQKFVVPATAVLLSKLNPEIDRTWLVDVDDGGAPVCSTEFLVLQPLAGFGPEFLYCLLRSPFFRQGIESLVSGTSKSHQRAQPTSILGLPAVIPPPEVVAAFTGLAKPIFDRRSTLVRETRTLAALRDALLPKLISGEIRVPESIPKDLH